ncbi:MAG TPA: glycosyltransferase [Gaiellales bacterium]|nr:glycosyltransferase [Gaiellales bacterium]
MTAAALPLVWTGSLFDPYGYADEARAYLIALDRAGRPAAARDIRFTNDRVRLPAAQQQAVDAALRRTPGGAFALVHHRIPGPGQPLHPEGPDVARTMFETDSVPRAWLPRLLQVDEVWVPCEFNLETFQRGGMPADRLRVLPETIDFDLFDPERTEPLVAHGARGFCFITNFDFTDRKGWDILLDAWCDAFAPDDDVCLVLKCLGLHVPEAEIRARIDAYLAGRPTAPILLDTRFLPAADMPRLYAGADAFVLASRGEGWGRPWMEAMAMGLPTIGSRWSGTTMFMHEANSWLVDGEVVEVAESAQGHTPFYRGHSWFHPDREALTAAMVEVRRGGAQVEARAASARAGLIERFGPEPIAARMAELTEGAIERWRQRGSRPVTCVWRGDGGSGHSLAVVNDALVSAIEGEGGVVERTIQELGSSPAASVGVAQHWPPSFDPPSAGPFVLYQPWEFGRVPRRWVEEVRRTVDEVWAPSRAAREAFVASGVAPDLVHVVPNGIDPERFTPDGPRRELPTRKSTVLLFVGGMTYRKGIDLLLEAYRRAFTGDDDVCLVLKAFGSRTFYRGQTAEDAVRAFQAVSGAPELLLIDEDLAFEAIPALYRACDVLVQPYRGEGFCLPALEALACGRPVIVTDGGSTDDFVPAECGWRVPSRRVPLPAGALPPEYDLAGEGFLLEPDGDALVAALRSAADPVERAARAARARAQAERFTWERAGTVAAERLAALRDRTPIRQIAPTAVPDRRGFVFVVPAAWGRRETWAGPLRAYAEAFKAGDDTTLVLPTLDEAEALALASAELEAGGFDLEGLADICIADSSATVAEALELAADAMICANGHRPARARLVVPADPAALRAAITRAA